MMTHAYRSAMQEQRERSGTVTSSNSYESFKDDSTSDKSEDYPHRR
jgi:hypothetical protein